MKQANFFSTYTTSGPRKFYFSVVTLFCNGILQVVLWYWATCACSYAIFQNTSSCINLDGEMYQCHIYQNSQLKKQSPRIICLSFNCNLSIPKVSRKTYISNVNMSRRVWRHLLISNVQYVPPPQKKTNKMLQCSSTKPNWLAVVYILKMLRCISLPLTEEY